MDPQARPLAEAAGGRRRWPALRSSGEPTKRLEPNTKTRVRVEVRLCVYMHEYTRTRMHVLYACMYACKNERMNE